MKILSLSEFEIYYKSQSFHTIIFSTENQSEKFSDRYCKLALKFNKLVVGFHPNIIYLCDNRSSMRLSKVKTVKFSEHKCMLGQVFTVVCGSPSEKAEDVEYTLIAQ